ncbi:hypothetical protein [Roseomonas sp. KE0001]|uniref:hypothetical protein n=1 Tax=unclassified Roseomonas TaxID=2617492 RepID=UPI0018DFB782|nr:hypothetical protein [Roseomonas sp. KE0001]MBI0432678.1 hypothetical protein [Roseomonas sp. KE0001]
MSGSKPSGVERPSPPPGDGKRPSQGKAAEESLEEALEDTFPASDPPAQSSPGHSVGWDAPEGDGKEEDGKAKTG